MGQPLIAPVADPWPWVHLRWPEERDIPKGAEHAWKHNVQMTWESRVRGSAGWLPRNYHVIRRLHLPGQIVLRPLPPPGPGGLARNRG
jgi:hypothetical protein